MALHFEQDSSSKIKDVKNKGAKKSIENVIEKQEMTNRDFKHSS